MPVKGSEQYVITKSHREIEGQNIVMFFFKLKPLEPIFFRKKKNAVGGGVERNPLTKLKTSDRLKRNL
jgi:hypothetical protein